MKNLLLIIIGMPLIIGACSKTEQNPGIVRIDTKDSLIFMDGKPIGHLGYESGVFQFDIPGLAKRLDSIDRALTKMEDTGRVRYDRMCLLTMRDEQPFIDLFRIGLTCFRSGFTYVQLQPLNQLAASELTLCLPDQPIGLRHHIYITAKGIWITLPYELCLWGPLAVPSGNNVTVPRARKTISPYPDVAAVFIPLQNNKQDWNRFEAELAQITEQLSRIGYTFGRHFSVSAQADLSCSDIRRIGRIIQKTLPKLKLQTLKTASFVNMTVPPYKGRIALPDNQFISADSFSVGIGLITDTLVDSAYFRTVDTTRFGLLGLDNLLVTALWYKDHALLESLSGMETDLNRYPALHFHDDAEWRGYTPLMLAIMQGDTFAIRHLLDKGADIHTPSRKYQQNIFTPGTNYKDTKPVEKGSIKKPIQLAKEMNIPEIIKLLNARMKKH